KRHQRRGLSAVGRPARRARRRMAGSRVAGTLGAVARRRRRLRARVLRRDLGGAALVSDDLFSLDGRSAIVTGGAGQIGAEIVRGLEARGARVAIFDIAADPFRVDVTDRSALETAVEEVGTPHVLVNAAALDSPPNAPAEEVGPVESYPESSFEQ